jgi:hypothetical protein
MYVAAMSADGLVKESAVAAAIDQVRQELKMTSAVPTANVVDFKVLEETLAETAGMK